MRRLFSFLRRPRLSAVVIMTALASCSGGGASPTSAPGPIVPPPPVSTAVESEMDVIFGTGLVESGSLNLLLDIYQPDATCTERRPFVIGIHGGGFVGGSKDSQNWVDNMQAIAAAGYAGISINYRLVGDSPVVSAEFQPIADDFTALADQLDLSDANREVLNAAVAAFEDTVTALDWARENADARCLDIDRFALWGSSAGAITALHVGHGLDDYFIDRPDPVVVIDYWGRLLLDGLVDADDPPFMIIHGTNDSSQIYEETALVLAAEADAVDLAYAFYTIEGAPHGFSAVNPDRVEINGQSPLDVTVAFIADHFEGRSPNYETQTIMPN